MAVLRIALSIQYPNVMFLLFSSILLLFPPILPCICFLVCVRQSVSLNLIYKTSSSHRQTKLSFLTNHHTIWSQLVSFSRRQKGVQRGEGSEAVQLFEQFWHRQIKFFGGVRCGLWSDDWSLCFKTPWGWKSGRFDCSVAPWFHLALWCRAAWGLIPRSLDWSCW